MDQVTAGTLDIAANLSETADALASAYAIVGAIDALFELAGPIDLTKVEGGKQLDHAHTLCRPLMEAIDRALEKVDSVRFSSGGQPIVHFVRLAA